MSETLTPITLRVIELQNETHAIQAELDALSLCGHYPLGSHRFTCRRCLCHWQSDCNDRAIERLLSGKDLTNADD